MPISFSTWLDGVVGTAEILANHDLLRKVWIDSVTGITSITSASEAQEQILDDLDSENQMLIHLKNNTLTEIERNAIKDFINILACFDECIFRENGKINQEQLLNSKEWENIEKTAMTVVRIFSEKNTPNKF